MARTVGTPRFATVRARVNGGLRPPIRVFRRSSVCCAASPQHTLGRRKHSDHPGCQPTISLAMPYQNSVDRPSDVDVDALVVAVEALPNDSIVTSGENRAAP